MSEERRAKPTRRGSGILGRNPKYEELKAQGKNAPQAKGRANIDGVLYWISAWTKTGNDGSKFQSLEVTRAEPKYQTSQHLEGGPAVGAVEGKGGSGGFDDDIPF